MTNQTYEREFFTDSYAEIYAAFRDRFAPRAQELLHDRKTDPTPTPNVSAFISLSDGPDGGVVITGEQDFVTYFESNYGAGRVESTRRALADAAAHAEAMPEKKKKALKKKGAKKEKKGVSPFSTVRPRFAFAHLALALMLVLSFALLSITSLLMQNTDEALTEVRTEITALESVREEREAALAEKNENADIEALAKEYGVSPDEEAVAVELSVDGEDTVQVYNPTEGDNIGIAALLSALADLWK